MKALQIGEPFSSGLIEKAKPVPGQGEVLLKMLYVGFCGTDLTTFRGANAMVQFPRIPGHEISAVVEAAGPGVPEKFRPGMKVTVMPYTSCGHCASCRRGRPNACENNETLGVQRDGAMQEYLCMPWEKLIPCEGLDDRYIALIEPMCIGFHAVSRGRVAAGDTVMVIGCGMVGLGAVVAALERGASVIAADMDDEKLALARSLGASYTYNTLSQEWDVPTPDVVIEAVGAVPTYRLAIDRVAFTGRVVCIGYAKSEVPLNTGFFVKKELDIMGSRNAEPQDFEAVTEYLRRAGNAPDGFISDIIEPEGAQQALNAWHEAPGKVYRILVRWSTES
ncbi:MAG: zinc-binding alcohol dehydrogenase family protein [Bacteroidales bacterium]|nr:zinc-binding alcohol dehydrogenase family protein [Bacteroidales bacterium]